MKRALIYSAAFLAVLSAVLCAYGWYRDNRLSNINGAVSFYVYPQTTPEDVLEELTDRGTVKNPGRLRKVFSKKKVAEYIKPGYYYLNGNSSVYVARMLNNGWQSPVNLTISGTVRRKSDVARKIGNQVLADSAAVIAVLNDKAFMDSLGFTSGNWFALFIPDTYQVYWTSSPRDIMFRMKQAYDAFWTEENLSKAGKLGLDRMQVATLASIVCAETNHVPEMPSIAGVYLNRLEKGMLLQADPTVAFCFDYKPQRILLKHLEVDSPYNTYKYAGLPPGPICVASREGLEAVLNPDCAGGNLYFCANPDFSGTHVFSRTLSEHNANARAFQAELSRRHRLAKHH